MQVRRRFGDGRIIGVFIKFEDLANALHIDLSFCVGWNSAIAVNCPFPRIVSGSDQGDVSLEIGQKPAQICQTTTDVLFRIKWLFDVESFRSLGYVLHQTLRIFR